MTKPRRPFTRGSGGASGQLRLPLHRFIEIERETDALTINREAAQLAQDLFPEYAWATDEPYPFEALHAMWDETSRSHPHAAHHGFDAPTLALFDEWIARIEALHDDAAS